MTKKQSGITGIILAAGESKRMGEQNKLTAAIANGETMLQRIACAAVASRLDNCIIVLGHDANNVAATLHDINVRRVVNHDYEKGQSTSIRIGVETIDHTAQAAMILLGDMPLVDTALINALITHHLAANNPQGAITLPAITENKTRYAKPLRGNPVIWGADFFTELKNLKGDKGGKVLFEKHAHALNPLQIHNADMFMDADTLADMQTIRKKL